MRVLLDTFNGCIRDWVGVWNDDTWFTTILSHWCAFEIRILREEMVLAQYFISLMIKPLRNDMLLLDLNTVEIFIT